MKIKLIYILLLVLFVSCNKGGEEATTEDVAGNPDAVILTDEQIKISDIKITSAQKRNMGKIIRANGILDVPPQSLVTISAPMGGFVKLTEVLQGMRVSKGQVIAQLEHQDYIQLQQDYLDGKIQLEFLTRDLEREKDMVKNNISPVKTLQDVTTRYKSMQNKVDALKNKLFLVGINAEELKEGEIKRSIPVISPINGYITKVNVNIGKYVAPNDVMFEIVDTKHLHVEITVFEKDAPFLRKDQKISFTLANNPKERTASVFLVSHSISSERTINVHAHLDKEEDDLMPGMYVMALIKTDNAEVYALPEEAFVKFSGKDYIFIQNRKSKDSNEFIMTEVNKGIVQDRYAEVSFLNKTITGQESIVTKGSFDLLANLKNKGEEE